MQNRASLCNTYKDSRRELGRKHRETASALGDFTHIDTTYRKYFRATQTEYEQQLSLLKETPTPFHAYVRKRKTYCPTVDS